MKKLSKIAWMGIGIFLYKLVKKLNILPSREYKGDVPNTYYELLFKETSPTKANLHRTVYPDGVIILYKN